MTDVPRRGAYGLTLTGLLPADTDLVADPPPTWPTWHTAHVTAEPRPVGDWSDHLDGESALVGLGPGTARLSRREAATTLFLPTVPTEAELAHPYLSATGAVAAWWRGDLPLHGGAFVAGGHAWALLGDREAGKSTTVAACWRAGAAILCDDLVVVRDRSAMAGPRTLDLREPTAAAMGAGDALGVVGLRPRWRITLDQVPAEVPMGGFVVLAWGAALALESVPMADRPAALMAAHGVLAPPARPETLLDLFALPFWRLTRPRDLTALDAMAGLLVRTLGG